jgi:cupin 2 domain-containing protein
MSAAATNLFRNLPAPGAAESFEDLFAAHGARIERIVSTGQSTPPGEWMVQDWDEWVVLIAGGARLLIDGEAERMLAPGDWIVIPADTRHRVGWTDPDQPTIWLAVHLGEPAR